MCDQQSLRSACAYAQSDQSLCLSLDYSMSVKLLTEHHLEFLSLKGVCTGSSESILIKMPHFWQSHVIAQLLCQETYSGDDFFHYVKRHIQETDFFKRRFIWRVAVPDSVTNNVKLTVYSFMVSYTYTNLPQIFLQLLYLSVASFLLVFQQLKERNNVYNNKKNKKEKKALGE